MLGGYVARKMRANGVAKNCEDCFSSLTAPIGQHLEENQYLIEKRSKGYLLVPSDALFKIIYSVEASPQSSGLTKNREAHHICR